MYARHFDVVWRFKRFDRMLALPGVVPAMLPKLSVADSSTVQEARNLPPAHVGARSNVQSSSNKQAIRLLLTQEC
jgi:hypothetical protein